MTIKHLMMASLAGLALVTSLPVRAADDDPLAAFDACGAIDGDAGQLACFRETLTRLMAARDTVAAAPQPAVQAPVALEPAAPEPAAQALAAPEPALGPAHQKRVESVRQAAQQEFGLSEKIRQARQTKPEAPRAETLAEVANRELKDASREPDDLAATISKVRRTAYKKIIVTLDNGQVWRETDGSRYRGRIRPGSPVLISKRALAGYQMKIGNQSGVVLVRRTK